MSAEPNGAWRTSFRRRAIWRRGVVLAGAAVIMAIATACQEVNRGPFVARTRDGVIAGVFRGCKNQHTFRKVTVSRELSLSEWVDVATIEVEPGAPAVQWFPLTGSSTAGFVVSDPAALSAALQSDHGISLTVELDGGELVGGSLRFRPPSKVGQAYLTERNVPLSDVTCP